MTVTTLPPAPQRTDDPQTFAAKADAVLAAQNQFVSDVNALQADVTAKQAAAATSASNAATSEANALASANSSSASSGVTIWVSGTTYAVGNCRFSPINFQTYRRITAGAGTTDPSADSTNWAPINIANKVAVGKSANYTAVYNDKGVLFNCSGTFTFSFTAASTLGNGWWCTIVNYGSGVITLDPAGSELIVGQTTRTLSPGSQAVLSTDGGGWFMLNYGQTGYNNMAPAIASASTINPDIVVGDSVHITGTTNISAITLTQGVQKTLIFDGVLTLTNGASLVCPGGFNMTTYAGMAVTVVGDASGVVRVLSDNQSPGMVLLATLTPTAAANVDFLTTFSSAFDSYRIIGQGIRPASGTPTLQANLANSGTSDTAANYNYSLGAPANPFSGNTNTTSSPVAGANDSSTSSHVTNFVMDVINVNDSTAAKHINVISSANNGGTIAQWWVGVHYTNTSVVSGIRFNWSGGQNFAAQGKIRVYGIRQ